MKKETLMISANEINRYCYCPYQWYYKKTYGQSELNKQYKALKSQHSDHENMYVKGTRYHQNYYKQYQMKRLLISIGLLLGVAMMIGVGIQ